MSFIEDCPLTTWEGVAFAVSSAGTPSWKGVLSAGMGRMNWDTIVWIKTSGMFSISPIATSLGDRKSD